MQENILGDDGVLRGTVQQQGDVAEGRVNDGQSMDKIQTDIGISICQGEQDCQPQSLLSEVNFGHYSAFCGRFSWHGALLTITQWLLSITQHGGLLTITQHEGFLSRTQQKLVGQQKIFQNRTKQGEVIFL